MKTAPERKEVEHVMTKPELVLELYRQGKTYQEIADETGLVRRQVTDFLRDQGVRNGNDMGDPDLWDLLGMGLK